MAIEVRKVVLEGVSDASGLERLIDDGVFAADEVIAVIGKTEGNGGVNDFTRILADARLSRRPRVARHQVRPTRSLRSRWCGREASTGCFCPHATVFARVAGEPTR